jgi:hypothetical protein
VRRRDRANSLERDGPREGWGTSERGEQLRGVEEVLGALVARGRDSTEDGEMGERVSCQGGI